MQTVVGVLRGGPASDHQESLRSGAAVLAALDPERYRARDIYIDKNGGWYADGRPASPASVLRQLDVALLPLASEYGESGEVQRLLDRFGVRYAGAEPFAASQARHKAIGKALAGDAGLLVPEMRVIRSDGDREAAAREVVRSFHQPVIVRAASQSGAAGVAVVAGYKPLVDMLAHLFGQGAEAVLVEECLRGHGAALCVVEGLRGEALYTCPAVELTPRTPQAYPYDAARRSEVRISCPGHFTNVQTEELARAARLMHKALGLRHCSRSDFIVSPRGVYYLETSASPSFSMSEAFAMALRAVGVSMAEFVEHLLARSLP